MCGKPIGSHKPLQLNGKNLIVPKILRIPSFLNFKLSRFYVILRFRQSCLLGSAFYLGLNFPPPLSAASRHATPDIGYFHQFEFLSKKYSFNFYSILINFYTIVINKLNQFFFSLSFIL